MLIFVFVVCSIEFIQKAKTDKALEELNKLSSLNVKVIRNKREITISSDDYSHSGRRRQSGSGWNNIIFTKLRCK